MSAIDGAYSPFKVFHHRDRLARLRQGRQPGPVHVQLVISDLCNQDCRFCAYRMSGYTSNELFGQVDPQTGRVNHNPNRLIPPEKIEEILDDCVELGVQAVQITGGGEPTVHPRHGEIFEAVLERGLDLALVTNGVVFRPAVEEVLLRAKWVRFSLDAGRAATYARVRRTSEAVYAKVLANIARLGDARRRALATDRGCEEMKTVPLRPCKIPASCGTSKGIVPALSRPHLEHPACELSIGVGFVVTKENWTEVADAARTARHVGADNFRISAVFQPENERYFAGWYQEAQTLCCQAEALTTESFRVFNLFGDRLEDLRQRQPDYSFCGYQHFTTYIGADLNVYRCCNTAYSTRGRIGSIRQRRFRDLWRSAEKEADFRSFDARDCLRCQFNRKNRMILYALQSAPADVAFV